ncbi:MAG: flavodoxin family protein [Thiotrichaceae bacterium]|nr:flavodoxin family protein [Thiotrichaceae bacterium]
MKTTTVLGLSASLRAKSPYLDITQLLEKYNPTDLDSVLAIIKDSNLTNSDASLLIALWNAKKMGATIGNVNLLRHFRTNNNVAHQDELEKILQQADAIIIATPVYFGNASSLFQKLVQFIANNKQVKKSLEGKIFAGIAVGAKRNGGQETSLVYMMIDMMNLGMVTLGNGADTTAQYGGTVVAGGKGSMCSDEFGIQCSAGLGKHVAIIAQHYHDEQIRNTPIAFDFWMLQEQHKEVENYIKPFIKNLEQEGVNATLKEIYNTHIINCLACDECPDPSSTYGCIVSKSRDYLLQSNQDLLKAEVIVPIMYSPKDNVNIESMAQIFIERGRFIRRDNYRLSQKLIIPLVFSDISKNEHLDLRMITALIRHNTIIYKPINGILYNGVLLNGEEINLHLQQALEWAKSHIVEDSSDITHLNLTYNPIGYEATI